MGSCNNPRRSEWERVRERWNKHGERGESCFVTENIQSRWGLTSPTIATRGANIHSKKIRARRRARATFLTREQREQHLFNCPNIFDPDSVLNHQRAQQVMLIYRARKSEQEGIRRLILTHQIGFKSASANRKLLVSFICVLRYFVLIKKRLPWFVLFTWIQIEFIVTIRWQFR